MLGEAPVPPPSLPPSERGAPSPPPRHFADLTNWNTPTGQPWFHARSASPNAAVDFPFPGPVWTITSGRFLRCLVVRPSLGTCTGCPCGIRRPATAASGPTAASGGPAPGVPDRLDERTRGKLVEPDQATAESGGESGSEPEPHRA